MTKQERAEKAKIHYEDIKIRLQQKTKESIRQSIVYGPTFSKKTREGAYTTSINLVDTDSVSCLFEISMLNGRTCILNYASYKEPGGLFFQGSAVQEEALCHESNLYPILLSFDNTYYAWNRRNLNRALYLDRAIYTPNVVFERNGERLIADVLTCAAPNYRTAHRFQGVSHKENDKIMEQRLNFIGQILENHEVKNFITGAWGCGVFMQNPEVVCQLSNKVLTTYNIPNIIYAIPNKMSSNFLAFKAELGVLTGWHKK